MFDICIAYLLWHSVRDISMRDECGYIISNTYWLILLMIW